ncbi:MAG: 2-dehydropantoate 2-reductase [Puniceicoccales bacterium]|jgi:2-dehydropantoate 2-reductase|nr:2-dehydropantoate 2-reductase [Puniceicoccales bacterium]
MPFARPPSTLGENTLLPARPLKIAIVGAGAVGAYYGCVLARAGHDVHFLLRSDYAFVREHGYQVRTGQEDFRLFPAKVARSSAGIGPCDLVIIALKTTANAAFPELLPPLDDAGRTLFLTLQNGLGNVEALARLFPVRRLAAGLCFVCINRTAPGVIESYIQGRVQMAGVGPGAQGLARELAGLFAGAGIACRAMDSLDEVLWKKLCWNIPFNGLAIAAGGIATDKIAASPALMKLAHALMEELRAAALAHGIAIPDAFIVSQLNSLQGMGPYKPSSLVDYLGRRPVEVDSIWGEPLRRGQARGLPMSRLEVLHALLCHLVGDKC